MELLVYLNKSEIEIFGDSLDYRWINESGWTFSYYKETPSFLVRPVIRNVEPGSTINIRLFVQSSKCSASRLFTKYIYVPNSENDYNYFSLSPNPATDVLTLSFEQENNGFRTFSTAKSNKEKYKIQLWNSLGLVKEVVTDNQEYRLSLHGIPAGFYYIHIIKGNQVIRKQLIIK